MPFSTIYTDHETLRLSFKRATTDAHLDEIHLHNWEAIETNALTRQRFADERIRVRNAKKTSRHTDLGIEGEGGTFTSSL